MMNYLISGFFIVALIMVFNISCKKNIDYNCSGACRLKKEVHFNKDGSKYKETDYSYSGNRITKLLIQKDNKSSIFDYTYSNGQVYLESNFSSDSYSDGNTRLEYVFFGEQLVEINALLIEENDSLRKSYVKYLYEEGNLVEYINYYDSLPEERGVYEYTGNKLSKFSLFYFKNVEYKYRVDELFYDDDNLSEKYVYLYNIQLDSIVLSSKGINEYDGGLLKQEKTFGYSIENNEWIPRSITSYIYDNSSNLLRKDVQNYLDSSLDRNIEFQYENGESNFDNYIYGGLDDDLRFTFPKPN